MIQRLFLDGINAESGRSAISAQQQAIPVLAFTSHANKTGTPLAHMQSTLAGTQVALDTTIIERMPPARWIAPVGEVMGCQMQKLLRRGTSQHSPGASRVEVRGALQIMPGNGDGVAPGR